MHQPRPLHAGLRAGRQGQHRHHLLAARACAPGSNCARIAGCARSRPTSTAWPPAWSITTSRGRRAVPARGSGDPRLQRHRHAAAAAELGVGAFPNGLANSTGLVGKNLMFHPYAQVYGYVDEPTDGNRAPPTCLWSKQFYETDRVARVRARLQHAVRPRRRAGGRGGHQRWPTACCRGARPITTRVPQACNGHRIGIVGDLRGPARGAQPRHARPGAEGQQRHPGAEDRLHDQREQPRR